MKGELHTKKSHFVAHKIMIYAPTHNCVEDLLDFVAATNEKEGMKYCHLAFTL